MSHIKELQPSKIKMSKLKIYSILFISALLTSFATFYFIVPSSLYTPGLGGIAYGIAYTINDIRISTGTLAGGAERVTSDVIVFWIVYLIFNIPIIYLTLRWYSKKFFIKSMFFFFTNLTFSMIFANVPGFNILLLDGLNMIDDEQIYGIVNSLSIMMFAILGGVTYGAGVGLAFNVGSCTMGLDPIAKYFSRERDINIVPLLFIITIINTSLWTLLRFWTSADIFMQPFDQVEGGSYFVYFIAHTLFSPSYIGSWIFVVAYSLAAGSIYSSNKKVQIFITTKKAIGMSDYFNSIDYHRGHTIYEVQGGYTKEKRKSIQMITGIEEMYDVVEKAAAIDPSAFITITELKRVYDVHDWRPMTEEDQVKAIHWINKDNIRRSRLAFQRKKREEGKNNKIIKNKDSNDPNIKK